MIEKKVDDGKIGNELPMQLAIAGMAVIVILQADLGACKKVLVDVVFAGRAFQQRIRAEAATDFDQPLGLPAGRNIQIRRKINPRIQFQPLRDHANKRHV